jgi:ribonuclease-3
MTPPDVAAVARQLARRGIRPDAPFQRPERIVEALTHGSCGLAYDNERLEMLGDAVLGHLVAQLLFDLLPEAQEGVLTRLRASLVDEATLAAKARELGLGDAMAMEQGEERSGGRQRDALLADAFEALLAAVHLSEGLTVAERLVRAMFETDARARAAAPPQSSDFKTQLQVRAQARIGVTPTYRIIATEGLHHEPVFAAEALIVGLVVGTGRGRTKKGAEQQAACVALDAWDRLEPALVAAHRGRG